MNAYACLHNLALGILTCAFINLGGIRAQDQPDNVLVNNPAADATIRDTQSGTAIVRGSGDTVIVAYNDSGSLLGANHFIGWSTSSDGGQTFLDKGQLPNTPFGDAGFPALARDAVNGNVYFSTLGFNGGLVVFKSTDNGESFTTAPVYLAPSRQVDLHSIAVDNIPGDSQGTIYAAWRDFTSQAGIYLTRSLDDGVTFLPPQLIKPAGPNVNGPTLAIGPDHAIFLAYLDEALPKSIKIRKSVNLGATFGPEITVGPVLSPGINGNLGLGFTAVCIPKLAVNPVTGNVYVLYPDIAAPGDRADIYFTESSDGGATWSPRVRVNNDTTLNDQFQPVLAVTPDGTRLFAGFYDRRRDPGNILIDVYGTVADASTSVSTFGGNFRINTESFPPAFGQDPSVNSTYMGYYDNAAADNNFFYYPWGDNRLGNSFHAHQPDVRMARIPVDGVQFADLSVSATTLTGANDSALNPDECNTLQVTLQNEGTIPLTGISATVVSHHPELTVPQPLSEYPDIPPTGTAAGTTAFRLQTSPDFPCFTGGNVTLTVTTDQRIFSFPVKLPAASTGVTITKTNAYLNFNGVDIPDKSSVSSPITVSGFNGPIANATVRLSAVHTFVGDLVLELISPDGTTVTLMKNRGGSGDDIGQGCIIENNKAVFDDAAATPISAGAAPFVGTFRPETPLAALLGKSGEQVNGTWQLKITDTATADTGTLGCWSLHLSEGTCTLGSGPCVCTTSLAPTDFNFGGAGGAAELNITSDCLNTPSTSAPWIIIDSFTPNKVFFHVEPNPSPNPRSSSINVDGQSAVVNQAEGCSYALSPPGALIPAAGSSGSTDVSTPPFCSWTAIVSEPWVTLNTLAGTGPATIPYSVQANPSPNPRSAFITVEGQTHQVIQWGDGPDLTGAWTITPLTCKTKKSGLVCNTKSYFSLSNIGTREALKFRVNFYLTADGSPNGAVLLKSQKIKKLLPGATLVKKASLKLPPGTGPGMFILGVIDAEQIVPESNRLNNAFPSPPLNQ